MKNLTVRAITLAIVVSVMLATCVLGVLYVRYGRQPQSASPRTAEVQYTLGVWQGQLAVFKNAASSPCKIYDVAVAALPVEEQTRLQNGIAVTSERELQALLEDYTS